MTRSATVATRALADAALEAGRAAGLDAVGIAAATPWSETRAVLEQRRRDGLHGGMAFTYLKPERSTDPTRALAGSRALVVGARRYEHRGAPDPSATTASRSPHARVARYAWRDHYAPLREALDSVASVLRADGWRTRVLADDNALVDREAARRAGIGWYGKNTNLLLPGAGSWFVLGSVVTDAPLPPTGEPMADGCGTCTRCLPACPTGALVAPGVLDARRCLAWLVQAEGTFPREHRVALGDRLYGCDDCQEVCPPNRRLDAGSQHAVDEDPGSSVDVLGFLAATDAELLEGFGRWYIPRRQPRYLRRNALVVLGNVGSADDPATVATIERYLGDRDPLLRAHAAWAAARIGRPDLARRLGDDTDDEVRDELARLGEVPTNR